MIARGAASESSPEGSPDDSARLDEAWPTGESLEDLREQVASLRAEVARLKEELRRVRRDHHEVPPHYL